MEMFDLIEISEESPSGLLWKISVGSISKGSFAGNKEERYWRVNIGGERYVAHRVVAFLSGLLDFSDIRNTQVVIDHVNGDGFDNRVCNLRVTDCRGNNGNRLNHRQGKLAGTRFLLGNRTRPWQARARVEGKQVHLGTFKTEQEAHEAYLSFVESLQWL